MGLQERERLPIDEWLQYFLLYLLCQDLEVQLQQESSTSQDTVRTLEDSLGEEKRRREDVEQELLKQKQELQYAIDELHKQKVSFQTRLNDRDTEIDRLRNQVSFSCQNLSLPIEKTKNPCSLGVI